MGIFLAIPIVALKQYDIDLPIIKHFTGSLLPFGGWLGSALLIGVVCWLNRVARGAKSPA
ncbi:MAG: hypothetical protein JW993_10645 [Sedimentisphaerales bacterium]|nr:hypothetical protein [Sedimentisphaerales bacterium]